VRARPPTPEAFYAHVDPVCIPVSASRTLPPRGRGGYQPVARLPAGLASLTKRATVHASVAALDTGAPPKLLEPGL
jgi:hypothetical protein